MLTAAETQRTDHCLSGQDKCHEALSKARQNSHKKAQLHLQKIDMSCIAWAIQLVFNEY